MTSSPPSPSQPSSVTMDHVLSERETRIRSLFIFFDSANAGYLDSKQIETGLSALQIPADYKCAKELLRVCDCDKDGRVEYHEFRRYMDVQHNGSIFPEEELYDALLKLEKTNVGEEVLDLVIPYIHNVDDRNSVSLVSRKCHETDGITRKRLTVHAPFYPNPASLSKRFPFIESLMLKGFPTSYYNVKGDSRIRIRIAPWIQQIALEFRCLKEFHIRDLVVHDEDLETLARTRGKELRSLKISNCHGFSSDGLRHVSKYCNQLRTLCLDYLYSVQMKDETWLHQLASNSTVLERLHIMNTNISDGENLTLLAKNCSNSLISLKIGKCYLSKLGDAFRYAVRLEHFGGYICNEENELVGFRFPPNTRSLSLKNLPVTKYSIVLPFLNNIRKLKLVVSKSDLECQCLLFERCPNLEVLFTRDVCGDRGLQVIGQFCKKLRKLTHYGYGIATHVGLSALAKGCTNLECLMVNLSDISNEAVKFVGTRLNNLRKLTLASRKGISDLPLDDGIRAMLMGCRKLERLDITLWPGGLTDLGFEYIGKYGANLRFLSLTRIRISNARLVKLSKGCPRLRKLQLKDYPFRKQAIANIVFNIPSLRYVWVNRDRDSAVLALIRPEFQL